MPLRVVVVGGGLSGLVAARALARHRIEVHVVEARQRLGGRVWTLRDDEFSTEPIEAGGEFIDGDHHAIRDLAKALGIGLTRVIREGFGLALEVNGRLRIHSSQRSIWRAFKRALAQEAESLRAVECEWGSSIAAALADHSLDALLRARRASAEVLAMAAALRGFFLADSDALSSLVGVELSMEATNPGDKPLFRVKGGNELLITELARARDVLFSFERVVKSIEQRDTGVRIAMAGPHGQLETVAADYAVVTVPPPVLLSWHFSPALPEPQRRALSTLSYGSATKAMLRFDTRWWRRAGRPRAFGTNLSSGAVWEATEDRRGPAVLTLLAGGRASEELQDLLESGGGDAVVDQLRWLGAPEPLREIRSKSWERDRWSRGGYAYFGRSFDPASRDDLGRAHGRVFFAGDHTSRKWQGYMNGAVESGQRAAQELIAVDRIRRA